METEPLMAAGDIQGTGLPTHGSTPGQVEARATITRTTITPSPTAPGPVIADVSKPGGRGLRLKRARPELAAALPPFPVIRPLRAAITVLLSVLTLLTVGGAILMLLLWQQDRSSGVLTSQVERTWDLFDRLREIERWVAFGVVPVAVAWMVLAAINVRRATGRRRDPIVAGLSLVVAVVGVWAVGDRIVAPADDWVGEASGMVLQAIFLAVPLLALERIAEVAEARHRPLRATYLIAVGYVVQLQTLGGLSTVDQTSGSEEWPRLGAYLVIGALLQLLGALSASESARAIEDGSQHRYELRHRFGESLLAQAESRR